MRTLRSWLLLVCSALGIAAPARAVLLYDVDFDRDPLGLPPARDGGPFPRSGPSASFGSVTVVPAVGALLAQPVELRGAGVMQLDLGLGAVRYTLSADLNVSHLAPGSARVGDLFTVLLSTPEVRSLQFLFDGGIEAFHPFLYTTLLPARWTRDVVMRLELGVDVEAERWWILLDGAPVLDAGFRTTGGDLDSVSFGVSEFIDTPGIPLVGLDRVRIDGFGGALAPDPPALRPGDVLQLAWSEIPHAGSDLYRVERTGGGRTAVSGSPDLVGGGPRVPEAARVAIEPRGDLVVTARNAALVRVDARSGDRAILSGCADPLCASVVGGGPRFGDATTGVAVERDGSLVVGGARAVFRVDPATGDRVIVAGCDVALPGCAPAQDAGGAIGPVRDLALDPTGRILVIHAGAGIDAPEILRIDAESGARAVVSSDALGSGPGLVEPSGIAVDATGAIYVADAGLRALLAVDPQTGDRAVLSGCGSPSCGSVVGEGPVFDTPEAVAVERRERVLVSDSSGRALWRIDPRTGRRTILSSDAVGSGWPFGRATGTAVLPPLEAAIDVRPGSDANRVASVGRGLVPVAILGSAALDVRGIDVESLRFGPQQAAPALRPSLRDVDRDGIADLVVRFRSDETGLAPGDREACLEGELADGALFSGCGAVTVRGAGHRPPGPPVGRGPRRR